MQILKYWFKSGFSLRNDLFNNNFSIKTYNLGSGNGISVKQLIDNFEEVNNTKINYKYSTRRDGDLDISYADSSLAEKEIGWKTKYNINDMVKLL